MPRYLFVIYQCLLEVIGRRMFSLALRCTAEGRFLFA
jgi:hypothetical protein